MSRRTPRGPLPRRGPTRTGSYGAGRAGRWSSPWVLRIVVIVAAAILLAAVVLAGMQGILFSVPSR
ncbi:hypothetical protein [uncultured Amnibacterium sp.]|uniref:hypothetical protein n=1 Tax=uncultured Amnibacterium sp. TaxID=1631851 RepID=UPI0035CA988D